MRNQAAYAPSLAVILLALCAASISAQVPTALDITRITPVNLNAGRLLELNNDTIAATQITLPDLLRLEYPAYSPDRIRGLRSDQLTTRFDVAARIDPPGVSDPVRSPRAQSFLIDALLKNHFHLKAHDALVDVTSEQLLATPDSTKMTPSPPHCRCSRSTILTSDHLKSKSISMFDLARQLSHDLHMDVVDNTHLQGAYAIDLTWTPTPDAPSKPTEEELLRSALQSQLGLSLVASHHQVLAIIIDNIEIPPSVIWLPPKTDSAGTALSSTH